MSAEIAERSRTNIMEQLDAIRMRGDERAQRQAVDDLCRFNSFGSVGNEWVSALPTEPFDTLSNTDVRSGLRLLLGITPDLVSGKPSQCPCGHVGFSIHHAFSNCSYLSRATNWRHNTTISEVRLGAQVAGFDTVRENKEYEMERRLGMGTAEHFRRGDLLVTDGESTIDTDLSSVHGAHNTYRATACKVAGAAVAQRDVLKHKRHDPGPRQGHEFLALSLDTYGAMGPDFKQFVKRVVDKACGSDLVDRNAFRRWWLRRISIAYLRGNVRLVSEFVGASIKSLGKDFEPRDEYVAL